MREAPRMAAREIADEDLGISADPARVGHVFVPHNLAVDHGGAIGGAGGGRIVEQRMLAAIRTDADHFRRIGVEACLLRQHAAVFLEDWLVETREGVSWREIEDARLAEALPLGQPRILNLAPRIT